MSPLFEYLKNNLSSHILLSPEENLEGNKVIKIKENKEEAKLKEISIYYNENKLEILAFTLDVNNILESDNIKNLFPYFSTNEMCSSTDAILFVRNLSNEDVLYIFYIELKSENVEAQNIIKKHIFMKKCIGHILDISYMRNIFNSTNNLIFPNKLYEGIIVFKTGNSRERCGREILFDKYDTPNFKGNFFKKAVKYFWNINKKNETLRVNLNLFLKSSGLEESEYEIQEFLYK